MTDCAKEEAHVHLQLIHTVTPRCCQSLSQYKTHFSRFLPGMGSERCLCCMGKLHTPVVYLAHKPSLILLLCLLTQQWD